MKKIDENVFYVGVNDVDKSLFEGLWPLPYGVSYNSYVVTDEKIALIDTVEAGFEDEFLDNINEATGGRPVDYLVVNHMEPDHSSLISLIMGLYPDLKVVANAKTRPMLKGYHNISDDRLAVIEEGQTLSLGNLHLRFHMIPMVHWPETMVTYLEEGGVLFSGDAFGTFGTIDADVNDGDDTFMAYRDEMIRYYSNIVGKYGQPVQSALKKLGGLSVERICSTHGPVWHKNIGDVLAQYDRMSRYETERGVCIAYGSMYGNTAAAAEALAEELEKRGVPYSLNDLAGNNSVGLGLSGALRDVFKYDTVVVGSPTYNGGIFPPVETFMKAMASRLVRNRNFFSFGSYSWAQASIRLLDKYAEDMEFNVLGNGLAFPQAFTKDKCDMSAVADLICGCRNS